MFELFQFRVVSCSWLNMTSRKKKHWGAEQSICARKINKFERVFFSRFHQYCAGFSTPFAWSVFKFVLPVRVVVRVCVWVSHAVCRHKIKLPFVYRCNIFVNGFNSLHRHQATAHNGMQQYVCSWLRATVLAHHIFECHHRLCATVTMNSII